MSERPQIVRCDASDSSRSYGRVAQRSRCGLSGKTLRDGPLRGLRLVWARSFGMTKPRSPKPSRSLPQRRRRARAELFRGSLNGCVGKSWRYCANDPAQPNPKNLPRSGRKNPLTVVGDFLDRACPGTLSRNPVDQACPGISALKLFRHYRFRDSRNSVPGIWWK